VTKLPDAVRKLFEGANLAHLATVLPDGGPHSVALWVGMEGDRIVFLTQLGSRKARNLDRDPRVAISITDRDQPNTMAQVQGRVVERLEGEPAWIIIDRLSHKYLGQPYPERTAESST
jgi:PPOX class probable F420-dependent enzyme